MLAPPRPPHVDDPEALIPGARARQRKRWLVGAALVAVLAGAALGIYSVVGNGGPSVSSASGPSAAVKTGNACGIRVDDRRIVDAGGRTLYQEPGNWTPNYPHPSTVRCSGSTAWVVWNNGAAMNQEGYVGARSPDDGRTWHLVIADAFFGVKAPHEIAPYLGPWTLSGPDVAYFTGWCPVCGRMRYGTVSLSVTKDGGRSFRRYDILALNGYQPIALRVTGGEVAITGKGFIHRSWRHKIVIVRVG